MGERKGIPEIKLAEWVGGFGKEELSHHVGCCLFLKPLPVIPLSLYRGVTRRLPKIGLFAVWPENELAKYARGRHKFDACQRKLKPGKEWSKNFRVVIQDHFRRSLALSFAPLWNYFTWEFIRSPFRIFTHSSIQQVWADWCRSTMTTHTGHSDLSRSYATNGKWVHSLWRMCSRSTGTFRRMPYCSQPSLS